MKTSWPDAAPLDGEELVFSISCGNSHLHWATHYGDAEDYNPQIFWRYGRATIVFATVLDRFLHYKPSPSFISLLTSITHSSLEIVTNNDNAHRTGRRT